MTDAIYHLLEGARLVGGHPMERQQKTDDNDQPKFKTDGSPMLETWMYVAFPKNGHADWRTTPLGKVMLAEATRAFKAHELAAPDFAWKVMDGDSAVPMRGGKPAPNTREGFPGNWVLRLTTGVPVRCYHVGKYGPFDQIQNAEEIKCGDYCSININIQANNVDGAKKTNGLYLNPQIFRLDRAGEPILFERGPSAADVFGGKPAGGVGAPPSHPASPVAPTNIAGAVAPPASPPPPPHNPLPKTYTVNGASYTREQLIGYGWTAAQIDAL